MTSELETVAAQLHDALRRIYCEELNGRICTMPDELDRSAGPREQRTCDPCRRHWERARQALDAFADLQKKRAA